LIALACSAPLPGHARWRLGPLAEKVMVSKIVEQPASKRLDRGLKDPLISHLSKYRLIPPKSNAAFAAVMEDIPAVYTQPLYTNRPLVCLDGISKQLPAKTPAPRNSACLFRY
jgi:hypothetical protein